MPDRIMFNMSRAALTMCVMYSGVALSEPPDAGAQQQQLQRELQRLKPEFVPAPPPARESAPSVPTDDGPTLMVTGFVLQGITLIPKDKADEALQPFTNRVLTFRQLEEAATSVAALYASFGRSARAVIPEQDVSEGIVRIDIIEAKAGDIIVDTLNGKSSRVSGAVIERFIRRNNPKGEPLSLSGLDRSIALINELPGMVVSGVLEAGDEAQETDVRLRSASTSLMTGNLAVSNAGSASTGHMQTFANLAVNSALGFGEQLVLDLIDSRGLLYGSARFEMPVGYSGWRTGLVLSRLDYETLRGFGSTIATGDATVVGVQSNFALERSVSSAKTLGFSFEKKNYQSAVSGTVFTDSEIYNLSASLSGLNRRPNLLFKWNVTASVGDLRLLNDNQATLDASGASTAGTFGKATFSAVASMPVRLIDDRTALTASVYGQLASKNLNSAEQFYLGGPYAIRAYPVAQGAGSQGVIASLNLSRQFGQSLNVGLFADAGVIQQYVSTWGTPSDPDAWKGLTRAANVYELYSGGITAAYAYRGLQLDATFAHRIGDNPLYNAAGKQLNVDNRYLRDQAWVRATLSF